MGSSATDEEVPGAAREEPFETPADPGQSEVSECPECGESFTGPMRKVFLGRHLKQRHGVESQKKANGKRPASRPRSAPAARAKKFDYEGTVLAWYKLAGDIWSVKDPVCAGVLDQIAPRCAAQWAQLAETSEGIRNFLETGGGTSGWIALALAHAPLVVMVNAHHVQPAIQRRRETFEEQQGWREPEPAPNDATITAPDFAAT